MWNNEQLDPFGLVVHSNYPGQNVSAITTSYLKDQIENHRVVIMRGFAPLAGDAFPTFCKEFGSILEWDFGAVNDLRVKADARNYLYTNHDVPFHWDGAFVSRAPHYIIFHCDIAPLAGSGGETLFCDTTRLLAHASAEVKELWKRIVITYTTEKIVHYGGTFTSPIMGQHPLNARPVLRYAEPVDDINPVRLVIEGLDGMDQQEFIEDMRLRLNNERCCYSHRWVTGDLVIADNYTLLHGRRAFTESVQRHIRRVNVI
jgi:alpha-ketoglutarate-dependent taurine dioxygenase